MRKQHPGPVRFARRDRSSVGLRHLPHDGQAQARPLGGVLLGVGRPDELEEDLVE